MIYCVICVHDYELCLREGTFFLMILFVKHGRIFSSRLSCKTTRNFVTN